MNEFLWYILKSTLCISFLYLVFRTLMRKETFFSINRLLLVTIVMFSLTIPLIQFPAFMQVPVPKSWAPALGGKENPVMVQPETETITAIDEISPYPVKVQSTFPSPEQFLVYGYLTGLIISVILLIYSVISVLILFRRARVKRMDGFSLVIIDKEIPAFSFSHFVFISQPDYEDHRQALLAHEQAHIQLKHFFDLIILETVKIFHWFNPVMYWLIRDLKEIHEFQADDHVLSNGIDSTQYQLLIIKKCVGTQRFALANSFNYCQIKKRITMINKQKTGTTGRWKVAAFLPLMALLPMAFGRTAENAPPLTIMSAEMAQVFSQDSLKQWSEADFGKVVFSREKKVNYKSLDIRVNSKSELIIGNKVQPWEDLIPQIQRYLDYSLATDELKPGFGTITINGQERMGQRANFLFIYKDESNSETQYQTLLNKIGEAVMQTRQKFAGEIFNTSYQKLSARQKDDIDILVPALAMFSRFPIRLPEVKTTAGAPDSASKRDEVFIVVEEMPQFPGGEKALRQFIATQIRYPAEAQKNNISGKVYITFVVNPNGKVDRAKIVRGIDPALDAEALRVVNSFPDWTPGKQRGKAVAVTYTVPITFDLASNVNTPADSTKEVFIIVEEMPQFPGGEQAMRKFIASEVRYPPEAQKSNISGKVYVTFVVNSNGKVERAKIARGVDPALDAEALRVVNSFPDWTPGKQRGKAVNVTYTVPIAFTLSSDNMTQVPTKTSAYLVVDEMPVFPGGEKGLQKFISGQINYPADALRDKKQGDVVVGFVVTSDGKVESVKVVRGVHPLLDAEALRVVSLLPAWKPGIQDGKPVDVASTVPVKFILP